MPHKKMQDNSGRIDPGLYISVVIAWVGVEFPAVTARHYVGGNSRHSRWYFRFAAVFFYWCAAKTVMVLAVVDDRRPVTFRIS